MEDNFKLGKKWFWVGIAVAFFHLTAGLIYGIALALEKDHRKEGFIIIAVSVIAAVSMYALGFWMASQGYLKGIIPIQPTVQMQPLPAVQ